MASGLPNPNLNYMSIPDLSPLWISLKVSTIATMITCGLGTSVAYQMYRYRGKARSLIEGILIAPLILPPTVVGFILLILLGKNGIFGQILDRWNLGLVFTWYAAVIAAIVVSFPLMYRAALGAFEQIDALLLDVARLEGASELAVFWYIALPLAIPGLIAGTVLTFARALGEFGATLMVAGNIPGQTQTMPMAIYFAVEAGAIEEGWFWTIIVMSISLLGIMAVNKWKV
jgi:molybdate transport system permease protein